MTDIVERLRASLIEELRDQAEGDDLYSEAADEIERLRADNKHWQTIAVQGVATERELRAMILHLRKMLSKEPTP